MKIIGLSGPSCSGKSTLARHLRLVLPNAAILYQDDFYRPESELPLDDLGGPNWDCPQSFDLEKLRHTLRTLKTLGHLPDQNTRENANHVSSSMVDAGQLASLRQEYAHLTEPILLVDGLILYHRDVNIDDLLDLKILMPFDYRALKERREARKAYATPEGEWIDPPNFFENVVWPEFLKHCGYLYLPDGTTYQRLSPEAEKRNITLAPGSRDMSAIIHDVMSKLDATEKNHINK